MTNSWQELRLHLRLALSCSGNLVCSILFDLAVASKCTSVTLFCPYEIALAVTGFILLLCHHCDAVFLLVGRIFFKKSSGFLLMVTVVIQPPLFQQGSVVTVVLMSSPFWSHFLCSAHECIVFGGEACFINEMLFGFLVFTVPLHKERGKSFSTYLHVHLCLPDFF